MTRFQHLRKSLKMLVAFPIRFSGQVPFTAKPDALFGLESRHPEQEGEHVEPVTLSELGEIGGGLRNQCDGLVRAAVAFRWITGSNTPRPARGCARPPLPCLLQKTTPSPVQC
jgi:hypothetical protein